MILGADGLEEAFIGVAQQFDKKFAVYDREKVVSIFINQGMTKEEALEYFNFNVVGGWVGESTPAFIDLCSIDEVE
jgi:hypothetical protein